MKRYKAHTLSLGHIDLKWFFEHELPVGAEVIQVLPDKRGIAVTVIYSIETNEPNEPR